MSIEEQKKSSEAEKIDSPVDNQPKLTKEEREQIWQKKQQETVNAEKELGFDAQERHEDPKSKEEVVEKSEWEIRMEESLKLLREQDEQEFKEGVEKMRQRLRLNQPEYSGTLNEINESVKDFPYVPDQKSDRKINQVILDFKKNLDDSYDLGKDTGVLMRFLAKEGLLTPDLEYSKGQQHGSFFSKFENKIVSQSHSSKDLKKNKDNFWEEKEFKVKKNRIKALFGMGVAEGEGVIKQPGGQNLIYENIKYDNKNQNNLVVYNQSTDTMLDLKQLLPRNFNFVPATVITEISKKDEDEDTDHENIDYVDKLYAYFGGELKNDQDNPVQTALTKYQGLEKNDGRFTCYSRSNDGLISYGQLNKKGGMLSLLHEIGHAWQSQYHSVDGRGEYEEYIKGLKKKVWEKIDEDLDENYHLDENYRGPENGRKISVDFKGDGQKEIADNQDVKYLVDFNSFEIDYEITVKSGELKDKIENYVREERDAWAHALRALRYLRKQGFDLEPEMKDLEDFKEYIHYALGTYQSSLESPVGKLAPGTKAFTLDNRYEKSKQDENNN